MRVSLDTIIKVNETECERELILIIEHLQCVVCRGDLNFSIYKTFMLLIWEGLYSSLVVIIADVLFEDLI